MSYQDRYGITKLRDGRRDNLSINWDYEDNADDKAQRFPVLFFTPDMENTREHYHIQLDRDKAKVLRDWLTEFLEELK